MSRTVIKKLPDLVQRLQDEALKKWDIVIPGYMLSMVDGKLMIESQDNQQIRKLLEDTDIHHTNQVANGVSVTLDPLDVCHHHLSDKLGIPKKYYDRMNDTNVKLLDTNVSSWFAMDASKNYFLRTFVDKDEKRGVARALLSDRYGTIDNYDVLISCLEAIRNSGFTPDQIQIDECEISDQRFYARFIAPGIEADAPNLLSKYRVPNNPGNDGKTGILSGFVITNSEVGMGGFTISPRVVISACSNGMVFTEDNFSRVHLGAKMEAYSTGVKFSENTKRKNQELIISQVGDAIKTFMSKEWLGQRIAQLEEAGNKELKNPVDTIKNVTKAFNISQEKEADILKYFMQGGLSNAFGVAQAMTFYAHETQEADERHDLEVAATEVITHISTYDRPFDRDKKVRVAAEMN